MDDREWQTFVTVVDEGNISRAAEKLFLSEKTVKNYITSIFKKIEVEDRVQATIYAIRNNIEEFYHNKLK